jgi:hypothetical protein
MPKKTLRKGDMVSLKDVVVPKTALCPAIPNKFHIAGSEIHNRLKFYRLVEIPGGLFLRSSFEQ